MNSKKTVFVIVAIILIFYGLQSSNLLTIINVPNYTKYDFQGTDGASIVIEGQTSKALSVAGHSYTAKVLNVPDYTGHAAVEMYKDAVSMGVVIQSSAPDCPSCADYYPAVMTLSSGVKGSVQCYTNRNSADTRMPLGATFCYSSIYFATTTTPQACNVGGVTYPDGAQVKLINGCYSAFAGKACPDNYQFTTCSNGVTYGASVCYSGPSCQSVVPNPIPNPTPTCSNGETGNCETSEGCAGTATCSAGSWGACIKTDATCGQTWVLPQWIYYVLIGIGIIILIWAVIKK